MKIGICCPADLAREMISSGFDYAEVGAHNLTETAPTLGGLPIEATNLFLPGDYRLFVSPVGDYLAHSRRAIQAASDLGVKVMVIGSGNQRKAPEGTDPDESDRLFASVSQEVQDIANGFGIQIAPESLNRGETNVGNRLGPMALALNAVGVGFTVDSFHVLQEANSDGLEIDWGAEIPELPVHVHLADLPRNLPALDDPEILRFFARLKELGYDSRISFEGSLGESSPGQAAERIRRLWDQ